MYSGLASGPEPGEELTLAALSMAFERGSPEIHHSDQGVQYAATDYVNMLKRKDVKISMESVGEPEENGYAERLMRTIKEEEVDLSEYEDFSDALRGLGRFLDDVYNRKRIHSSLGYLTPAEFEQQWIITQRSGRLVGSSYSRPIGLVLRAHFSSSNCPAVEQESYRKLSLPTRVARGRSGTMIRRAENQTTNWSCATIASRSVISSAKEAWAWSTAPWTPLTAARPRSKS